MIVDESEEVGLATGDHRTVEGVAGPQVTWAFGLEAREGLWWPAVRPGVEPESGEVPLQCSLGGTGTFGRADDLGDLGGGAPWHSRFSASARSRSALVGHRFALTGDGCECAEAAFSVGPDPAVDGAPGEADPSATRPGMVACGELAHEHCRVVGSRASRRQLLG